MQGSSTLKTVEQPLTYRAHNKWLYLVRVDEIYCIRTAIFFVLVIIGELRMTKKDLQKEGKPLAVCINDCQVDCGQPQSELRRLCFQLNCAFAKLRWGASEAYQAAPVGPPGGLCSAERFFTA